MVIRYCRVSWVLKLSLLHSNTFSLWQLHFCRASCLLIDKREFVCLVGRLTLIKIVQVSFKNVVIYSFQCIVRWKWRHKEGRRQSSLYSSFFGPGYWWHVSVQLRPELSKRNPATRVDCTMLKYHPHCFKESVNTWLVTKHRCPTLITNALKTSHRSAMHFSTLPHLSSWTCALQKKSACQPKSSGAESQQNRTFLVQVLRYQFECSRYEWNDSFWKY